MNTSEISRALSGNSKTKQIFLGVFPSDRLPIKPQLPCALVCNTDPSNAPGQHWIAMYIDTFGNGEFFDSYGQPPGIKSFQEFLENNSKLGYCCNSEQLQGELTSVCGQYCIFYLVYRLSGFRLDDIRCRFPKDRFTSDCYVVEWVRKHCKVSTEVFEDEILFNQICLPMM